MKAKTLQILWHGKDPVWSVDFHKDGYLATAGADKEVKLWRVEEDADGAPTVKHLESLTGSHNRGINVVRFAPSGDVLASGADGGELILWKPTGLARPESLKADEVVENCSWKATRTLVAHNDDVQDVSWAPHSDMLMSGSVDNSCIVWDSLKCKAMLRVADHKHYVQGVAWDPAGEFLVSQSGDRTCRVYSAVLPQKVNGKTPTNVEWVKFLSCSHVLNKREVTSDAAGSTAAAAADGDIAPATPATEAATAPPQKATKQSLFHDDTVSSFFRRLAWSPDGSFVAVPTGLYKQTAAAEPLNTLYIYNRHTFNRPAAHVPGFSTPVVAVRFCPTLFELKPSESAAVSSPNAVFDLPYRMIFAVATIDSVLIMDTQHLSPLALVGGVHWAAITDLAWAADGRKLVVSSSDGYCSVVLFEQGELGAVMDRAKVPAHVAAVVWPEPRVEKEKEVKEGKATAAAKAEGGENANPNLPPAAATAAQAAPRRITPAAMPTTTTTGASVTGDAGVTGDAAAAAAPRRITSMATSAAAVSTSEATTEGGAKRRIAPVAMDAMPVDATTDDAGAAPSGTQGDGEGEAAAVPAAAAGKKRRIAPMAVVAAADTAAASV